MCKCIEITNNLLAKQGNTELDIPITFDIKTGKTSASHVLVATRKRDNHSRTKPMRLIPAYCPFCGKKYQVGVKK